MTERAASIHQAKTHLSRLVERVEGGEEIVIAWAGRPVARLVPFRPRVAARTPGLWRGLVRLAPDFDVTGEETLASFEQ